MKLTKKILAVVLSVLFVVGVFAGDGHVAEVEQHLQYLRQHQRQAEQQDIFPQRAAGHLDLFHTVPPNFRRPDFLHNI